MTEGTEMRPLPPAVQPRLVCLTGDLKGSTILLDEEELTFGRVSSNRVRISDPHVSRRHARILRVGEAHVLFDLESQNGTFVNGIEVREHALREGDEIRIAGQRFVFLDQAVEADARETRETECSSLDDDRGRTITLRRVIAAGEEPAPDGGERSIDPSLAHRLMSHMEALRSLAGMPAADAAEPALLERLIRMLVDAFQAERACILLVDRTTGALETAASALREERSCDGPPVSRTIVQKVAAERVSVLCSDAAGDERLSLARSVSGLGIRSVLCTPLVQRDTLLGVLYLDNRSLAGEFTADDLWLLKTVAGQVAILVDYLHLLGVLNRRLRSLQEESERCAPAIVGESGALRALTATARKAADSSATILVLGESGTGKEVLARSIHRWSRRRDEPFVVVNCAALADQLLQSDLFGHERGAFTGAIRQKKGRLEIADGGTVFLDEIGEIDREMQAKFLRFLQEREFDRLGGTRPIRVDVRIIAASNRDLAAEVKAGRFREDLYYRLRVVEIVMPPLRERRGDIPLLAEAFLREYCLASGARTRRFSRDALQALKQHAWPGNVRELRNCIERAVVLGAGETIEMSDLGLASAAGISAAGGAGGYRARMRELKRAVIREALDESGGQRASAAAALGLRPAYLSRLMKNLGMR